MSTRKSKSNARTGKSSGAKGSRSAPRKRAAKATKAEPPQRSSLLWRITKWSLVFAIWGGVILGGVLVWFAWDLPSVENLGPAGEKARRPGVTILAADGSLIAGYGDLYGRRLTVNELPPELVQAVVAIEDRRFFEHPGVDFRGLLRAMIANLRAGGVVQGGSTLTQQLAKNLFLTPERSYERKIKELLLALALEHRFQKDELLTIYLNRVYFGAGTYGVEAAAQRYFGASARDVDTYQAAVLAGLLRAPSRLNPDNNAEAAHNRALTVLGAMVAAGFVKPDEAEQIGRTRRPGRGDAALPRPRVSARHTAILPTGCLNAPRAMRAVPAPIFPLKPRWTRVSSNWPKPRWPGSTPKAHRLRSWRCAMTARCWPWSAVNATARASSTG